MLRRQGPVGRDVADSLLSLLRRSQEPLITRSPERSAAWRGYAVRRRLFVNRNFIAFISTPDVHQGWSSAVARAWITIISSCPAAE